MLFVCLALAGLQVGVAPPGGFDCSSIGSHVTYTCLDACSCYAYDSYYYTYGPLTFAQCEANCNADPNCAGIYAETSMSTSSTYAGECGACDSNNLYAGGSACSYTATFEKFCSGCSAGEGWDYNQNDYGYDYGDPFCAQCIPGNYQPNSCYEGECLLCPDGSVTGNAYGSTACSQCADGEFAISATRSTTCTQCPTGKNSIPAGSLVDCQCSSTDNCGPNNDLSCTSDVPGGYVSFSNLYCSGTFISTSDCQGACDNDPLCFAWWKYGPTNCQVCKSADGSIDDSIILRDDENGDVYATQDILYFKWYKCRSNVPCIAGYEMIDYADCTECPAGKFQPVSEHWAETCQDCPVGEYSATPGATACTVCAANTIAPSPGSTACIQCPAGQFQLVSEQTCQDCPAGKYSATPGATACTLCAANTIAPSPGSTSCTGTCTPPDYFSPAGYGFCLFWPEAFTSYRLHASGSYCTNYATANLNQPSWNDCEQLCAQEAHCVGFIKYWEPTYPRTADLDTNCYTCNSVISGQTFDTAPLANWYTFLAPTSCDYGQALAGPQVTNGPLDCADCPVDTYQDELRYAGSCKTCDAGESSPAGSTSADACVVVGCDPGQAFNNGVCQNCPANTYQDESAYTGTCKPCADDLISAEGSTTANACLCNVGFTGPDGGGCTACEAGKYKAVTGSAACDNCIDHSNNELFVYEGTTFPSDRVGLFTSAQAGSSTCGDCVANAELSSGTCKCSAGYYRAYTLFNALDVDRCDACPINTYKSTVGIVAGCQSDDTWSDGTDTCADYEAAILNYPDDWCGFDDSYLHCCICSNQYDVASGGSWGDGNPETMIWVQSQCTACPDNSYASTTANEDATACKCNAGYTGPDGGPCVACEANTYKTNLGSEACATCPTNSVSLTGSTTVTNCLCDQGYSGPDGGTCTACAAGTYKSVKGSVACTACPGNSVDVNGHYCICNAGYYLSAPDTCLECSVGSWKSGAGNATEGCTNCGDHMTTYDSGSTEIQSCKCNAGYYGDYEGCQVCAAGSYSDTIGNTICTDCPVGSSSLTNTNDAESDCVADKGYEKINDAFVECQIGFYKSTIENILCTECSHGSSTTSTGSTLNTQCQCISPNYYGTAGDECLCSDGYARWYEHDHATMRRLLSHEDCNICEEGKYCPAETNSADVQLLSSDTLPACPVNSYSPAGSSSTTDCVCNAGYTGPDGGPCTACAAAKYKDATGSAECSSCASFETSPEASVSSAACVCEAGYGHDGSTCTECAPGSYKDIDGDLVCTSCADQHETSSAASVSADACVCTAGYSSEPNSEEYSFTTAAPGTFCADGERYYVIDDRSLIGCKQFCYGNHLQTCLQFEWYGIDAHMDENGNYVPTVNGACVLCAGTAKGLDGGVNGNNGALYIKKITECVQCDSGKYKDTAGDVECTDCAQHETSPQGSVSADACVCLAGYAYEVSITYTDMGWGYYCATGEIYEEHDLVPLDTCYDECSADATCTQIQVEGPYDGNYYCKLCNGNTQNYAEYTPLKLHVKDGGGGATCVACEAGKYKTTNADTACDDCPADATSPTASAEHTDCFCNAGYSGSNGGACTICPTDTYQDTPGSNTCEACPENSQSPQASVSEEACQCNAGYEENSVGVCMPCVKGKYKTVASHDQCIQCRSDSNTALFGSDSASDCLCNSGYYDNAGTCVQCASGTYKTGLGNEECTSCPGNSDSPQGSSLESQCICNAGYETSVSGASISCAACDPNFYEFSDACVGCPSNSQSAALSTSISDCKCNQGYTGPDGGECVACGADKYKDSVGSSVCTSCEANMNSPVASTSSNACLCNAGFSRGVEGSGSSTSPCQPCEQNTYCPPENTVTATSVNVCPDNSNSPVGSDELTDCKCNIGYAGPDGQACQICDFNYYTDAIGSPSCLACPEYSTTTNQGSTSIDLCECNELYKRSGSGESTVCHRECGPGFEASDDESRCVGCRVSYYKSEYGDHDCTKCPGVSYSLVKNQTALNSCICPQGYVWNGTWCHQCEEGKFNNRANQTTCFDCTTSCDTYSRRRHLLTTDSWIDVMSCGIVLNELTSTITTGSIDGQYDASTQSWSLPAGYYITHTGLELDAVGHLNIFMRFKINNYVNAGGADVFMRIENTNGDKMQFHRYNSQGAKGRFIAINSVGTQSKSYDWELADGEWIKIMFKMSSGSNPIQIIREDPDNGYNEWFTNSNMNPFTGSFTIYLGGKNAANEISDIDLSHFYMSNQDMSWPTDEDLTCAAPDHTTCPGLCRAPAGYRVNADGNNVELCPVNHYQDGSAANCTKCPSPETYSSEGGLTSVTECECRPGYTRVGGTEGTCMACETGTYKAESGDGPCIACGDNANTAGEASDSVSDCLCEAGYTQSGDQCAACGKGGTKHILSNVSCIQCPEHSTLYQDKQHHIDNCQCNPGYSGFGGNNPCVACQVGKFSVLHGDEMQCHDCPVHATTESAASKNESFCVCETLYEPSNLGGPWDGYDCVSSCGPGFTGNGNSCQKCTVGSFKSKRGGESCTFCTGVRSNSRPGSISSTNCSCAKGKFGVDSNKFVVIDSIGGWSENGVKVISDFTQASSTFSEFTYNLLDGEAYRSVFLKPGGLDLDVLDWQLSVKIDNLILFFCTFKDCPEEKEVFLSGLQGVLKVSGYVKENGNLKLYTRKTLTLQGNYSFWNDELQAQAESLVARKRNRAGEYLFTSRNVFSDSECINCPPKLNCKEFI